MNPQTKRLSILLSIGGVLAVIVIAVAAALTWKKDVADMPTAENVPTDQAIPADQNGVTVVENSVVPAGPAPATGGTTPAPVPTQPYRDGTYSATGSYRSPAGAEQIGVTLTLKNGVVTAASATAPATNQASKKWQETFAANFAQFVVGKSIESLSLGVVSGSSLTPLGFNEAAAKIRSQARS